MRICVFYRQFENFYTLKLIYWYPQLFSTLYLHWFIRIINVNLINNTYTHTQCRTHMHYSELYKLVNLVVSDLVTVVCSLGRWTDRTSLRDNGGVRGDRFAGLSLYPA